MCGGRTTISIVLEQSLNFDTVHTSDVSNSSSNINSNSMEYLER
jgi:hypothetical protein